MKFLTKGTIFNNYEYYYRQNPFPPIVDFSASRRSNLIVHDLARSSVTSFRVRQFGCNKFRAIDFPISSTALIPRSSLKNEINSTCIVDD